MPQGRTQPKACRNRPKSGRIPPKLGRNQPILCRTRPICLQARPISSDFDPSVVASGQYRPYLVDIGQLGRHREFDRNRPNLAEFGQPKFGRVRSKSGRPLTNTLLGLLPRRQRFALCPISFDQRLGLVMCVCVRKRVPNSRPTMCLATALKTEIGDHCVPNCSIRIKPLPNKRDCATPANVGNLKGPTRPTHPRLGQT